jgi:hypothetical protein
MNNRVYPYISETSFSPEDNVKEFSFNLPLWGGKRIGFGVRTQRLAADNKRFLFFVKLSGKLPEETGGEARRKMFGLQLIRYNDRIRLGFISRSQTIKKAG